MIVWRDGLLLPPVSAGDRSAGGYNLGCSASVVVLQPLLLMPSIILEALSPIAKEANQTIAIVRVPRGCLIESLLELLLDVASPSSAL